MRYIELSGKKGAGKRVIVDDTDFREFGETPWFYDKNGYVYNRHVGKLHRLIMGAKKGEVVDHKNHDILDNRRCNLRLCTKQNNSWNMLVSEKGTSRFKGVCLQYGKSDRWTAQIHLDDKKLHIGLYASEEDAARAYNRKASELFGEFALLNDVDNWKDFQLKTHREKYQSASKYQGVCLNRRDNNWVASVYIGKGKMKYVGAFSTPEKAAIAYNNYVIEHHMDKALNFVEGLE